MAYQKALRESKYSFIKLRLVNLRHSKMKAIQAISPEYGIGDMGLLVVTLKESSGDLRFEPDETRTEMVANVFDCEKNRNFLASHTAYNFWEIVDDKIREEIQVIADDMTAKAIRNKKNRRPKEEIMSDEQLEAQLARLTKEKSQRQLTRIDSATVRPMGMAEFKEASEVPEGVDAIVEAPEAEKKAGKKKGIVTIE